MHRDIVTVCLVVVIAVSVNQPKTLMADPGVKTLFNRFRQGIFPGTLWCGKGNIAKSDGDLGRLWEVDTCCRTHDRCPIKIKGRTTRYGLENKSTYTRLHCTCDEEFYRCLKKVKSISAKGIGTAYFNVLKPKCFRTFNTTSKYVCSKEESGSLVNLEEEGIICAEWQDNPRWSSKGGPN